MTQPSQPSVYGDLKRDAAGNEYWEVHGIEAMPPFLVSLVSDSDVWAYISTVGGLTAGRRESGRCLFPYETDDRLHHAAGRTGPLTLIRVAGALWQPFDARGPGPGRTRVLRKAAEGHWLELEERAPDLGLVFRQRWTTSRQFGLVRRCTLEGSAESVELLDGLLNLMPAGVQPRAQEALSALVDAYKRSELIADNVGLYAMDALLSDQAAPAEALRANVVWRRGLPAAQTLLTADAVRDMRAGRATPTQPLQVGQRGAYLVRATVHPAAGPVDWDLIGDVHLDHAGVVGLLHTLQSTPAPRTLLDADLHAGAARLIANIASADGLQHTADRAASVHHFANVTFNNMRGGVFAQDHQVDRDDLTAFLTERNRVLAERFAPWLEALPPQLPHPVLVEQAEHHGDPQLVRLCLEYLPLVFSRRHGDPSRPWNAFSIRLRHPDGRIRYSYEGNWRDIFQNWEALCRSFPDFLVPIIAKFVNASTRDGHNPYRILREGVDWEVPDPEDPWANIGYWGDHQIVYLFRLLEAAEAHAPGSVRRLLGKDWFSSADVPYRIRSYAALCRNAKDSIEFDEAAHEQAERRRSALGGDGRLVADGRGAVLLTNLFEKLLISVLAKLSNLVVDGGIWMNTQRPEWNDANNALVGQGLSMVTLMQLRRALAFLQALVEGTGAHALSEPVHRWLDATRGILAQPSPTSGPVSPEHRRQILDQLGTAFSEYRAHIYVSVSDRRVPVDSGGVVELCGHALRWLDHTIHTNRRSDGLFHSYNLLSLQPGRARVEPLYEMLEGQVNVLASGVLAPAEAVSVLEAMFRSRLYRSDQHSFLLYPFRSRPRFLERNVLAESSVQSTPLLAALSESGANPVLCRDANGQWHFHADLTNAADLSRALDTLATRPEWAQAVLDGRDAVLDAYEATFQHLQFTGRSGTMYKYEGLGCIYWHMVSKLLLAVQECWQAAADQQAPEAAALAELYYKVRRGLSFNKTVAEYGAIPTDPYSHTPAHLGAQQPGMTGQVKEEILTRFRELGVRVVDGRLGFCPALLRRRELLDAPSSWRCLGPGGEPVELALPAESLAWTYAQTPIILSVGGSTPSIRVEWSDGRVEEVPDRWLDSSTTRALLSRTGAVSALRVCVPDSDLTLT
jgi:hypothetical protein